MSHTARPAGGVKPGRKPLTPGVRRVATSVSLTTEQATRFKALGGSAWLREMLYAKPMAKVNSDGFLVEVGDLLLSPGMKLYALPDAKN